MSSSFRRIFAVLVACGAGIIVVRLLEELAKQVTMPPGVAYRVALERGELPFASFALVLCGWWLAAYTGSRIAAHIAGARVTSLAFAVVFTGVVLRELSVAPHPGWMWLGGLLGVPLVALGAVGQNITIRGL
ncbi:MAG: hypothetical protein ACRELE_02915 [Gemmatimonadales bacterium]